MTEIFQIVGLLEGFLSGDLDHLWHRDERVQLDGNWDGFRETLENSDADLLATMVRSKAEDPCWNWWTSLNHPNDQKLTDYGVAALLPLVRFSRNAATAILRGLEEGITGHPEALLPTLIHRAGLKIEDIGGSGSYTPPGRIGRWYDSRSWCWRGPVEHVLGMLHFPVTVKSRPLAAGKMNQTSTITHQSVRVLYVSPVGEAAKALLPQVLDKFRACGCDCLLFQYDEAVLEIPSDVRAIRDRGGKWQLAINNLRPDTVTCYDFIFFWDDDIDVGDFDPIRFIKLMSENRLSMAQPAIQSPHRLSHGITSHRACPPPFQDPDGGWQYNVVGRITNFVEIMVPVFTRESWREFYCHLDPDNASGWGYDYIPLGRKGIIDAMPVIHTRAIQSHTNSSSNELNRFLENQGIFCHLPLDQGQLFEYSNFNSKPP